MEQTGTINCVFSKPVELDRRDFEFSEVNCSYNTSPVAVFSQPDLIMAMFLFLIWITLIMGYFIFRVLGVRIKKTMI